VAGSVLVTGASGFIAKHVVRSLLDSGYEVRGTVRAPSRGEQVSEAVRQGVVEPSAVDERLTFTVADLELDEGWGDAMEGIDAVVHTASPFPIAQPKDESVLIRPAVEGTLRVLRAAHDADIDRVVLTSSTVAIVGTDLRAGREMFDEEDWTDVDRRGVTGYARSKTLAERAAWSFVRDEAPTIALTTINPAFVSGPPLDDEIGSSMSLMVRILSGKDPMLPRYGIPVVDVRDVAEMHVRALQRPDTAGKRYIAAAGSMWLAEMGGALKAAHPDRKIATRSAPNLAMRALGLFDREVRSIVPNLGSIERVSNQRAIADMDMTFIPPEQALCDAAAYLLANDLV
jgi:dihydroflavonol-4-reductase